MLRQCVFTRQNWVGAESDRHSMTGSSAAAVARRPTTTTLRHLRLRARVPRLEYSLTGSLAAAVARRPTSNTLRHLRLCARVTPVRRTSSTLQHLRPCARVPPPHRNLNTCQPLQLFTRMTPVGFEPTPFRNGALSHRLRPLSQSVDDFHVASKRALAPGGGQHQ